MSKIKVRNIEADVLQGFVQGKIPVSDIFKDFESMHDEYICDEGFQMTLEDVIEALKSFLVMKPFDFNYINLWFQVLHWVLGDVAGLPEMTGNPGIPSNALQFSDKTCYVFATSKEDIAYEIICGINSMCDGFNEGTTDEEVIEIIRELLQMYVNYPNNIGKSKSKYKLTPHQIKKFVYYHDEESLDLADDEEKKLYKKYLEELVKAGDLFAIKQKAYACYGYDHPVYKCDWVISRDCLLTLMEKTNGAEMALYANTLGYIYYYGRTNGGTPQYEEAYKYFSLAAFYGYYEAIYKVGDMIMGGKGTFKNEEAAFNMYKFVYDNSMNDFIRDGEGQFADAALRMGGCFKDGKGCDVDLMSAYAYYMEAKVASDERMKYRKFFGDEKVASGINEGLNELREKLGKEVEKKKVGIMLPGMMQDVMLSGNAEVEVGVKELKNEYKIKFKKKTFDYPFVGNMLITVPPISFCKYCDTIELYIDKKAVNSLADVKSFKINKVKEVKNEERYYYNNKLVMSVAKDAWVLKAEKKA